MATYTDGDFIILNNTFARIMRSEGLRDGYFDTLFTDLYFGAPKQTLSNATSLYVSTTGSDKNPGTVERPFLTIQAALNSLRSFDINAKITISVGPGTFDGFWIPNDLVFGSSASAQVQVIGSTTLRYSGTITTASSTGQIIDSAQNFSAMPIGSMVRTGANPAALASLPIQYGAYEVVNSTTINTGIGSSPIAGSLYEVHELTTTILSNAPPNRATTGTVAIGCNYKGANLATSSIANALIMITNLKSTVSAANARIVVSSSECMTLNGNDFTVTGSGAANSISGNLGMFGGVFRLGGTGRIMFANPSYSISSMQATQLVFIGTGSTLSSAFAFTNVLSQSNAFIGGICLDVAFPVTNIGASVDNACNLSWTVLCSGATTVLNLSGPVSASINAATVGVINNAVANGTWINANKGARVKIATTANANGTTEIVVDNSVTTLTSLRASATKAFPETPNTMGTLVYDAASVGPYPSGSSGGGSGIVPVGTAVSGALGVNMRNNAGNFQLSQNTDRYRSLEQDCFFPEDYGAVGDGVTNDGPAIQACIDDAALKHKTVKFQAKTYMTGQELRIAVQTTPTYKSNHAHIVGVPLSNDFATVIKAMPGSNLRAVMFVGVTSVIDCIQFDGNSTARCALYLASASLCKFYDVAASNTIFDGVFCAGELDTPTWKSDSMTQATARGLRNPNILLRDQDLTSITSTASVVSGNPVITFTGSPALLSRGIVGSAQNPNLVAGIWIKNGNQMFFTHINTVQTDSTILVNTTGFDSAPNFTASNCEFLIFNYANSINDTNAFTNFSGGGNGAFWATSGVFADYTTIVPRRTNVGNDTVAVVEGSFVITFGAFNPLDNGLRAGDIIYLGPSGASRGYIIGQVYPNRVELIENAKFTNPTSQWACGRGDTFHECQAADNNIAVFSGTSLIRGAAGVAFAFSGFYGPLLEGCQVDYCGMGAIRIGIGVCFTPTLIRNYFESCGPNGNNVVIYLSNVHGAVIIAPLDPTGDLNSVQHTASWGMYIGWGGMQAIGVYRSNLLTTELESPNLTGVYSINDSTLNLVTGNNAPYGVFTNSIVFDPAGADRTLTGTPTFNGPTKPGIYTFRVKYSGDFTVRLYDDVMGYGGTKLKLDAASVVLGQGGSITFLFDGVMWTQISKNVSGFYSYSDTTGTPGNASAKYTHGRAMIASGQSSCTIITPAFTTSAPFGGYGVRSQVLITPNSDFGSGVRWWVSNNGDRFTLNLSSPAATNLEFTWECRPA